MSQRMTSTTVYLTESQIALLDRVSARLRVPKAVLVRDAVEAHVGPLDTGAPLTGGVLEGEANGCPEPHVGVTQ